MTTRPPGGERDAVELFSRVYDVEARQRAGRITTLDDLRDVEVPYGLPALAPVHGDTIRWDNDRGLWVNGGATAPTFAWDSGAATIEPGDDIYDALGGDAFFARPALWAVTITAALATLPADATGATLTASAISVSPSPRADATGAWGSIYGSWCGADGTSGLYGWQAQPPIVGAITASAVLYIAPTSAATLVVAAAGTAHVLDTPGTSDVAPGSRSTTAQDHACQISVAGVKVWDAELGSHAS